jgi:hypothetical protein
VLWVGFVLTPTWIRISSLMSIQIRIRHQNDADPHADITPRFLENQNFFTFIHSNASFIFSSVA